MDIHHLKVFAAVFRNRSFSRASEELLLSQPTVSDHIKSLEKDLECRLFDRLGRSIVPTREAEALYDRACEIIEKVGTLKEAVGQSRGELAGDLLIGASTIPGTYLLPGVMMDFKQRNPSVHFKVEIADSRETIQRVLSYEMIAGIVGSKQSSPHLQYIALVEDELVIVASPGLPIKDQISIDALFSYPMICREDGSGTRREFEKHLLVQNVPAEKITIAGYFSSTDAVKQAVKTGAGIAVISRFAVEEEIKSGSLKLIRLSGKGMKRNFYIVTHKKRTLPAHYAAFLDFLKNSLKSGKV